MDFCGVRYVGMMRPMPCGGGAAMTEVHQSVAALDDPRAHNARRHSLHHIPHLGYAGPHRLRQWFVGCMPQFATGGEGILAVVGKTPRRSYDRA